MSEKIWDVFVSYKRDPDEELALDLLAALESAGLKCWIAPRDVRSTSQQMLKSGTKSDGGWDDAIPYAIENSYAMAIIVSKAAMESRQIQKEVYLGDDCGIQFFPVLLEDIPLERSFKYHLGRAQWLNCFKGDGSQRFLNVASEISGFLGKPDAFTCSKESCQETTSKNALATPIKDASFDRFTNQLLERSMQRTRIWSGKKHNGRGIKIGFSRKGYYLSVDPLKNGVRIQFWIRMPEGAWKENLAALEALMPRRTMIDTSAVPHAVEWKFPDENLKTAFIEFTVSGGYNSPEAEWPRIQDSVVDAVIKFEAVMRQEIERRQ